MMYLLLLMLLSTDNSYCLSLYRLSKLHKHIIWYVFIERLCPILSYFFLKTVVLLFFLWSINGEKDVNNRAEGVWSVKIVTGPKEGRIKIGIELNIDSSGHRYKRRPPAHQQHRFKCIIDGTLRQSVISLIIKYLNT